MPRRMSLRGIAKDRVYTLKLAARAIGKSEATLRKWRHEGLRTIDDKRPYLVRGGDLILFVDKMEAARKSPLSDGQFHCMGCHASRPPRDGVVHYVDNNARTGRLVATCAECGAKMGRFCSAAEKEQWPRLPGAPPT